MKLSKTPPINQACRGIDFLSSFPSSLSLPAPLHSKASDVSQCKTNVTQRVKRMARVDPHAAKTFRFLSFLAGCWRNERLSLVRPVEKFSPAVIRRPK